MVRLYIRCPKCSGEIALKTDPKNSDYILEVGATRNYEPWRDTETQARTGRGPPLALSPSPLDLAAPPLPAAG